MQSVSECKIVDNDLADKMDIAIILSLYVYLDNQSTEYNNKTLGEIFNVDNEDNSIKNSFTDKLLKSKKRNYAIIKNAVEKNSALKNIKLIDQSICSSPEIGKENLIACAFETENKTVYVAFKGTDAGKWIDNGDGLVYECSNMQEFAKRYFEKVIKNHNIKEKSIIVAGHSKGGNEAQYVTLESKYSDRIDNCFSFDGQGFSPLKIEAIRKKAKKNKLIRKMYSINCDNDYVNNLGEKAISDSNTYYISDYEGNGFGAYHKLSALINDNGRIRWTKQNSTNCSSQIGMWGEFSKDLYRKIKENFENKEYTSIVFTMMILCESLNSKKFPKDEADKIRENLKEKHILLNFKKGKFMECVTQSLISAINKTIKDKNSNLTEAVKKICGMSEKDLKKDYNIMSKISFMGVGAVGFTFSLIPGNPIGAIWALKRLRKTIRDIITLIYKLKIILQVVDE